MGKSKYTMKITSQLTNGNKIKRKIRNITYRGKGQGREGTNRANAKVIVGKGDEKVKEEKMSLLPKI